MHLTFAGVNRVHLFNGFILVFFWANDIPEMFGLQYDVRFFSLSSEKACNAM